MQTTVLFLSYIIFLLVFSTAYTINYNIDFEILFFHRNKEKTLLLYFLGPSIVSFLIYYGFI